MKIRKLILLVVLCFFFFCFKGVSAEANQMVTIESYRTQALSVGVDGTVEIAPFKKSEIELYYYDLNGQKCLLQTMQTDELGYIKNVVLDLPDTISRNQLFFRYVLKNENYGFLVDTKGAQYRAITSTFIPTNRIVNIDTTREFPNAENISHAVKTWELYVSSIDAVLASVAYAEEVTSYNLKKDFSFEPIAVQYENGSNLSNSFNIAKDNIGLIGTGTPYISITNADVEGRLINLVHEWSHWIMYCSLNGFNTGGGYYNGHYTICDPRVSWKEGWAITQANLITTGYWNWPYKSYQFGRKLYDTSPQTHNVVGKSTISTVNGVIIDIFDKDYTYKGLEGVNEEEFFDLASDHSSLTTPFDTERAIKDGQLAIGLMNIAMINSEATTLSEYIHYLKSSGMIKNLEQFDAMLAINGIDSEGNFTSNSVN